MKILSFITLLLLCAPALAIEEPAFDVVQKDGSFEIRHYAPYVSAEVVMEGDFESAGNQAFRPLFRFISGDNSATQEISMTAPVEQTPAEKPSNDPSQTRYRVGFVMPTEFDLADLPVPDNQAVTLHQVPERLVAVWRYRGNWSQARYQRHEAMLRERLAQTDLVACGPSTLARFNPPFWPGFLRRNEVHIPVQRDGCKP